MYNSQSFLVTLLHFHLSEDLLLAKWLVRSLAWLLWTRLSLSELPCYLVTFSSQRRPPTCKMVGTFVSLIIMNQAFSLLMTFTTVQFLRNLLLPVFKQHIVRWLHRESETSRLSNTCAVLHQKGKQRCIEGWESGNNFLQGMQHFWSVPTNQHKDCGVLQWESVQHR